MHSLRTHTHYTVSDLTSKEQFHKIIPLTILGEQTARYVHYGSIKEPGQRILNGLPVNSTTLFPYIASLHPFCESKYFIM